MAILSVKAVGDSLVHNFMALQAHRLQFVGRKHDIASDKFVILSEGEVVEFRHEYKQAVLAGDLECMDDESRILCGLPLAKVSKK
jgi:hypothetical protein